MQKLSTYGAAKVQFEKAYSNIHMGLNASYSRAQTRMNQMVDKTYRANQGALLKHLNTSKFGDLLASGATGKSIRRFGLMEKAALGRFYATKQRNLTQMQYAMDEGTKLSRRKAAAAQENEFARVAFQPTEDVAPPIPVMQNVGLALFGDILNVAGTVAGIKGAFD